MCDKFMGMRRGLAIFAFLSLLVSSTAVWPAAGCCGVSDCCKSGMCPMHHQKRSASSGEAAGRETHCQHAASNPLEEQPARCHAAGDCSHQSQATHISPQMRAVLPTFSAASPIRNVRAEKMLVQAAVRSGFDSLPFEPPRLSSL